MGYESNSHIPHDEMGMDATLPPELEPIAQRLMADGNLWQAHLPDVERVAERIRAIPWQAPHTDFTGFTGGSSVSRGDDDYYNRERPERWWPPNDPPATPPGSPGSPGSRERVLGLIAAVVVVALLAGLFVGLARQTGKIAGPANTPTPTQIQPSPTPSPSPTPGPSKVTGTWRVAASPDQQGVLKSIAAVTANDVWAVGSSNGKSPLIEHWNGSQWSIISSPVPAGSTPSSLNAVVALSANDVWAVGTNGVGYGVVAPSPTETMIEHWNGGQWSIVPSPNKGSYGSSLLGVSAVSANDIWAVGYYISAVGSCGGIPEPLIERWNGTQWSIAATPAAPQSYGARLYAVSAASANDAWAVGDGMIEHYNGSTWTMVPQAAPTQLLGVTAISPNNVWAVGTQASAPVTAHWDGSQWRTVPNPHVDGSQDMLISVSAVAANDVWAVGGNPPQGCGSTSTPLIEHWNGTSWSVVTTADLNITLGDLQGVAAVSSGNVWAVGEYWPSSGGAARVLIAHYTG